MGAGAEALLGRVEGALSQGSGASSGAVYAAARRHASTRPQQVCARTRVPLMALAGPMRKHAARPVKGEERNLGRFRLFAALPGHACA
jgi:hypothetical protein